MKRLIQNLMFVVWLSWGVVIWAFINSWVIDFESYLMQLKVGNKVVIDASSPVVVSVQNKLISHYNMWINQLPNSDVSLGLSGEINLNDKIFVNKSEIQLVNAADNVFTKGGNINYRLGNVIVSNQWWAHVSIWPGWASLLNINNGTLRVYSAVNRPGCTASSVGLVVWDSSGKLLVCEAKTDFYGRPINGQYEWHQVAR